MCGISDANWKYVVDTFNLDSSCSLTYIIRERQSQTQSLEPTLTSGKRGHEIDLLKLIGKMIEVNSPESNERPLPLKFAFDGSRVMGKNSQEIGTVDPLWGVTRDGAKSHHNSVQWIIFLGEESNEVLREELVIGLSVIKYLIDGGEIEVKGKKYKFDPYLVCDMACLTELLGLYHVYHPSSTFKCCWCEVPSNKIGDFTIEEWPMRDLKKMKERMSQNDVRSMGEHQRARFASTNFGMKYFPVIEFLLPHIVPCFLHIVMAITRVLLEKTVEQEASNPRFDQEMRTAFKNMNVKLVPVETKSGKVRTVLEQIKKSRFQYPHYLTIIENQDKILAALRKESKLRNSRLNLVHF
jgi:hypothetical protein